MRVVVVILVAAVIGLAMGVAVANLRVVGGSGDIETYKSFRRPDGGASSSPNGAAPGHSGAPGGISMPLLKIDQMTHQFGEMQRGAERSHKFEVSNTGNAPLELRGGDTSCKCTSFVVPRKPLLPGESGEIELTWVAKAETGLFRQTATVLTNDPRASRIELSIEGTVIDVSGLEPQMWYLGRIRAGSPQSASVTLMAYQQDTLEVTRAEIDDPAHADWFDIEVVPLDKSELDDPAAKAGVRINVTTRPGIPLGEINSWVNIETDLPPDGGSEVWERQVGITGRVQGDLTIRGTAWNENLGAVNLGFVKGREGAEARLFISAKGDHADDITYEVASIDSKSVEVELGTPSKFRDDVTHTDLIVRVPQGHPPVNHLGNQQGEAVTVTLATNHPITPEMTFQVRFAVQ